jgi:hypothetical protein
VVRPRGVPAQQVACWWYALCMSARVRELARAPGKHHTRRAFSVKAIKEHDAGQLAARALRIDTDRPGRQQRKHRCDLVSCATTSQPHHNHVTTTSQPRHNHITTTSQPRHNHITTTSQPHHNHITTTSQPHHNHITTTSQPHHNHITPKQNMLEQC